MYTLQFIEYPRMIKGQRYLRRRMEDRNTVAQAEWHKASQRTDNIQSRNVAGVMELKAGISKQRAAAQAITQLYELFHRWSCVLHCAHNFPMFVRVSLSLRAVLSGTIEGPELGKDKAGNRSLWERAEESLKCSAVAHKGCGGNELQLLPQWSPCQQMSQKMAGSVERIFEKQLRRCNRSIAKAEHKKLRHRRRSRRSLVPDALPP